MMTDRINRRIRAEAELWLARRRESAVCEQESEAFERWRSSDPRHAEAYAAAERFWERLAILKQAEELAALVPPPMKAPASGSQASSGEIREPATQSRRRVFYALAASVAAVAIAVTMWFNRGPEPQTFATALGEQRTETLADGTTLRLNTASTLEVRMSDSRREIALVSGEAAFDVAKDATRPFIVAAGDGTVTAVGTHFQVRHEGGAVAVTLIEGRVQLARPAYRETEWLDPGQQATFSEKSSGIIRRNVDVRALTSWMSGRLEFQAAPLEQAVAEVNRYSARKLRIADPAINQVAVSGTFRTGDVDGVAAALEAVLPVRAEVGEQEIALYPN